MFEVIVGNIGAVYRGTNGFDATVAYNRYVGASKRGEGRAAGESVIMMRDCGIVREHEGDTNED